MFRVMASTSFTATVPLLERRYRRTLPRTLSIFWPLRSRGLVSLSSQQSQETVTALEVEAAEFLVGEIISSSAVLLFDVGCLREAMPVRLVISRQIF